ncbi:uncharacterized protein A1O9_02187 [Exophiala aquamarina CBS 119918]|uniref:Transcription factor domain-containing protein n=1 Tax=Exophiala aquamarina CBS 119918 TaxID=1182545 RepID=A0A072PL66_9EURO|nr:uncharacterized protein A1O9_02187 [Exophiala aquamarina CBS 119918]KEF60626.1 hypothetical protein A1O9_02187 [Exophiala aquamarina CBS 119918]
MTRPIQPTTLDSSASSQQYSLPRADAEVDVNLNNSNDQISSLTEESLAAGTSSFLPPSADHDRMRVAPQSRHLSPLERLDSHVPRIIAVDESSRQPHIATHSVALPMDYTHTPYTVDDLLEWQSAWVGNTFPFQNEAFFENPVVNLWDSNFNLLPDDFYRLHDFQRPYDEQNPIESRQPNPSTPSGGDSPLNHTSNTRPRRIATAYEKLRQFSTAEFISRPSSPSAQSQHQRWLANLASVQSPKVDRAIINVFLGLFQSRLSETFQHFRGFYIRKDTPTELYLAMAAVGGLYCSIAGSADVARWLYYSAQHKLLTKVCAPRPANPNEGSSIVSTYILLELFGYLSGDRRIVELIEVYHFEMLQAARDFGLWRQRQGLQEDERKSLIQSLFVLECYRVVLLQKPPMFYPCSTPRYILDVVQGSGYGPGPGPEDEALSEYLRSIAALENSGRRIDTPSMSVHTLYAMSLLTTHVTYRAATTTINEQDAGRSEQASGRSSKSLWQMAFFELVLNNWRCVHSTAPSANTMMLFHTIHLNMYASLPTIQELTQKILYQAARNPTTGQASSVPSNTTTLTTGISERLQRCFRTEDDCEKALWHANQILRLAQQVTAREHEFRGNTALCHTAHHSKDDGQEDIARSPHFMWAVYFATLCFWFANSDLAPRTHQGSTGDYRSRSNLSLARERHLGQAIMAQSECGIARLFHSILEHLGSTL